MEALIRHYLRILDIDSVGQFVRLINVSQCHALDISDIHLRQFSVNVEQYPTLNSFTFHHGIQSRLPRGQVVTIYARDQCHLQFDSEPCLFIARNVSRWLTSDSSRTEISINNIVFDQYTHCSSAINDIPSMFIDRQSHLNSSSLNITRKCIHPAQRYNRCARFLSPYCLPTDNIVNPHSTGTCNRKETQPKPKMCYDNDRTVQLFELYPRRLTTVPKTLALPMKSSVRFHPPMSIESTNN